MCNMIYLDSVLFYSAPQAFSISINETPTRGTAPFSGNNDTLGHSSVGASKRK